MKLNEALGSQIREKRLREENEARANKSYMNRWVERAEEDNRTKAKMENSVQVEEPKVVSLRATMSCSDRGERCY